MNPEWTLLAMVSAVVAGALLFAWRIRDAIRRRRAALREMARVELPIVSSMRRGGIVLGALTGSIALVMVPAILLDETRAHALPVACSVVVVSALVMIVALRVGERVATVGRLAVDEHELVIEHEGEKVTIDLDAEVRLREAVVLQARTLETLVIVDQGAPGEERVVAFRYPCLFGEKSIAPQGVVAAPLGVRVGAEALVVHERLKRLTHLLHA